MANLYKLFILLYYLMISVSGTERHTLRTCQEITIPMCKAIGYNMTYMPNQFNHDNQEEAGLEVHQFWPLVEIQCSPDLQFFLCSMYTPICVDNYNKPLPACRSVCERAKAGCAPLMRHYGFSWPERMKCEDLPVFGDKDNLCMDFNTSNSHTTSKPQGPVYKPEEPTGNTGRIPGLPKIPGLNPDNSHPLNPAKPSNIPEVDDIDISCSCYCRTPLVKIRPEDNRYYNAVSTGGIENCAMNCKGGYFTPEAHKFAVFWIGAWSILCCISTLLTVLTFFIDMQRFEYPERPIIFLSACYLMISIGYIIRLIAGQEAIACDSTGEGNIVRYQTTGPALCTIVFLLIYFFSMASSIWWVILSFTWFLAAGLKWGQEAISSYSQYFHIVAWLIPSIKSITILAMSSVDGDHISGICYVGNQNLTNLRAFVLAPLFLYLILGTSFLLAGFVSLFRIRDAIKQQGQQRTEKLEKLMIRIGVFSVLYTVPATVVIACNFYEQHYKEEWDKTLTCTPTCPHNKGLRPDYSVFMLKYFMCLVVGITSGFWVWSSKTVASWRKFCCRCGNLDNSKTKYTAVSCPTGTTLTPLPAPTAPPSGKSYSVTYSVPSHV